PARAASEVHSHGEVPRGRGAHAREEDLHVVLCAQPDPRDALPQVPLDGAAREGQGRPRRLSGPHGPAKTHAPAALLQSAWTTNVPVENAMGWRMLTHLSPISARSLSAHPVSGAGS